MKKRGLALLERISQDHLGPNASCSVYESNRARHLRISISYDDGLRVVVPTRIGNKHQAVRDILEKRKDWIKKHWDHIEETRSKLIKLPKSITVEGKVLEWPEIVDYAKTKIKTRTDQVAQLHGFSYNKIYVPRDKKFWGSCSRRRNLSFNWRIVLLSPELFDYVIYHELAHLRQFNHSKYFWEEMENIYPGSKTHSNMLKKIDY